MFLYFIFVLLAIIAIVVTVKLLHNHQQRALQERANEDLSLPPVDPDSIPERDGLEWEEENTPNIRDRSPGRVDSPPVTGEEQKSESESEPEPEPEPIIEQQQGDLLSTQDDATNDQAYSATTDSDSGSDADSTDSAWDSDIESSQEEVLAQESPPPAGSDKTDWKEHVQALKNANQFDEALKACQVGWPQWQSYQQAAIVCRAAFRQPDLPEAEAESWREALYLLATHASFLHDKVDGMENLSWQRLEKTLAVEDLRNLDSNWQEIGYQQLRLLNKTDCRLLSKSWGEPEQHQSAKHYYKSLFLSITTS